VASPQYAPTIKISKIFARNRSISSPAFLIALITAVVLANFIWLYLDQRPFAWDESIHYMGALGYYKILQQGGVDIFKNLLYLSDFYPPFTEFIGGCLFLITRPCPDAAAFLDVFLICGIIWLLFLIGRRAFGKETGILAGYFFAAASAVVIQSKVFMLDISLAFFVTFGFYAFYASENFLHRRWVITYGVVLGLALLNKWSAVFFLGFSPLLPALIATCQRHGKRRQIWLHVLLAFFLAGLIAGPWYVVHFFKLIKNTSGYIYARGVLENDPPLTSPAAWFYYLGSIFRQTSVPLGLLIFAGVGWLMLRKRHAFWMAIWLGVPYLILTLIRNKDHRYIIPLLPLLCLAGASWIQILRQPLKQRLLWCLAVTALLQMTYCHLGQNLGWFHFLTRIKIAGLPFIDSWAPDTRRWPLGAILADVETLGKALGRRPVLRVIPDHSRFSRVTFALEQTQLQTNVQLSSTSNWPMFTDFAVTKTRSLGLPFNVAKPRCIHLALQIEARAENPRFELLRKYPLPDGSQALLYGRREIVSTLSAQQIEKNLHMELDYLLSGYVRHAQAYSIEIIPYSNAESRIGRFKTVRILAQKGSVGDFKHNSLGVPFAKLDIEIKDLILDTDQLEIGKLVLYSIGSISVNELVLETSALNQALSQAKGELQALHVSCNSGKLTAQWRGLIPVQIVLTLQAISDPNQPISDNLRFQIHFLRVGWLMIPGWLIQPLVEDFNPLFKLAGFPGTVKLGQLYIQEGRLQICREKNAEAQEKRTAKAVE